MPASVMSCLAKALLPSRAAPAAPGPKMGSPRSRNTSATPATRGISGPTTVRSICERSAKSASCGRWVTAIGTHSAMDAMPGLPGAAYNFVTRWPCANFQVRACSRAPEPITSIRMLTPPELSIYENTISPHPAGDHKGPPNPTSSALAPTERGTERLAFYLASCVRLMRIWRPRGVRPNGIDVRLRGRRASPAFPYSRSKIRYATGYSLWHLQGYALHWQWRWLAQGQLC